MPTDYLSEFGNWVTSGWSDAWQQWQHPIDSVSSSVGSTVADVTTAISAPIVADVLDPLTQTISGALPSKTDIAFGATGLIVILVLVLLVMGKFEAL